MLSPKVTDDCLARLGMLRFFPTNDRVVAEVGRLLNEICKNDKEVQRLTAAIVDSCSEWPGPSELKAIYSREFSRTKYFDPTSITRSTRT